jgi:hypothetical protein
VPVVFLMGAAAALPTFVDRQVLKAQSPVPSKPVRRASAGQPRSLATVAMSDSGSSGNERGNGQRGAKQQQQRWRR